MRQFHRKPKQAKISTVPPDNFGTAHRYYHSDKNILFLNMIETLCQ